MFWPLWGQKSESFIHECNMTDLEISSAAYIKDMWYSQKGLCNGWLQGGWCARTPGVYSFGQEKIKDVNEVSKSYICSSRHWTHDTVHSSVARTNVKKTMTFILAILGSPEPWAECRVASGDMRWRRGRWPRWPAARTIAARRRCG